jgi:hypothetical protein
MSSEGEGRTRAADLPGPVSRTVEALATHRGRRGVVLGGGRGESGDRGPGRDWDLLVYLEGSGTDPVTIAEAVPGLRVSRTPHMPMVDAEATRDLEDGDTVDVLFIRADLVRRSIDDSRRGHFGVGPMARMIAGMPSYVLEAEIVLGVTCAGDPPPAPAVPPEPLVVAASRWWHGRASLSALFARDCVAKGDDLAARAHLLAAAEAYAHVLGLSRGWYLPSKVFLTKNIRCLPDGEEVLGLLRETPSPSTVRALATRLDLTESAGLAWAGEGREQGVG